MVGTSGKRPAQSFTTSSTEGNAVARNSTNEDAASAAHGIDNNLEQVREQASEMNHIGMNNKELPWWAYYQDVWVKNILSEGYVPEETRLSARLLHIKKNEMNRSVSIYSPKGGKTNAGFLNNETSYDRIFLFGSLGTHSCFVILSSSARKSSYLLQGFIDDSLCVGQTLVLLEPIYTRKNLGKNDDLPILDVKKRFEPYTFPMLPSVDYVIPEEACSRHFTLHGIRVDIIAPIMQRSQCGGYLCDRQILRSRERGCCCLFNSGHSSLVLEMIVKLYKDGKLILEMEEFRSWLLTNILIANFNTALTIDDFRGDCERNMRISIKRLVQYVNQNGGWVAHGWMRRGTQVDAAEKNNKVVGEEVTAESISPHIIRLEPYKVSMETLKHMAYKQAIVHVNLV